MYLKIQSFPMLFLTFVLFTTTTTTTTAITPGSTLSASNTNQTWPSPSSTFFLGFVPVQKPTNPPSFIAAIYYSGSVPVVWSAGNGTTVDSGGSLQFLSSGALRLVNGSGATVWDSGTANRGASNLTLQDDGNLVISNRTSTIWSSFDHLTDTLLPSQNFTVGKVLRSGSYSFSLMNNGNLTLKWNDSILFWNQGLNSSVNVSLDSPVALTHLHR